MAYPSTWPNAYRHVGLWACTALGRSDRGDPAGRCRLVCAGGEALARRSADDSDDSQRDSGETRWQNRRLDGESERRAIPGLMRETGMQFLVGPNRGFPEN